MTRKRGYYIAHCQNGKWVETFLDDELRGFFSEVQKEDLNLQPGEGAADLALSEDCTKEPEVGREGRGKKKGY